MRIDTNVDAFKQALQKKANADEVRTCLEDQNARLQQTELSLQVSATDLRAVQSTIHSIQKSTLEL